MYLRHQPDRDSPCCCLTPDGLKLSLWCVCREREELRRRIYQAKSRYRQKRELYDYMMEDGLELEELINEEAAKREHLTDKLKQYDTMLHFISEASWKESDLT